MPSYTKISELTAGSAIGGTELLLAVQDSESVYVTADQIATYVAAATALTAAFATHPGSAVSGATVVTGEFIFTDGDELDYSSSFTNDMASALTTFAELPTTTVAILAQVAIGDTGTDPYIQYKRAASSSVVSIFGASFADVGTNRLRGPIWIPTYQNTIYVTACIADTTIQFYVLGYKTGG